MKARKLSIIAIFSVLSFILMVFISIPLISTAPFLKIDLSFIPIFIGMMLTDLKSGYLIIFIRTFLKILLDNTGVNDYIGLPMNMIGIMILMTILYYCLNKKWHLWIKKSVIMLFGPFLLTLVMIILNYFYAIPLYAKFANFNIIKIFGIYNYIVWMLIPFNLLEGFIIVCFSLFIFPFVKYLSVKYK